MRGEVWRQALSLAMAVVLTACGEPSETFQDAAPLQHAEPGAATLEEPETPVLDDDTATSNPQPTLPTAR
jgi:hypothetical protein